MGSGEGAATTERWLNFVASASAELGASLDYRATFERVAVLAVPELADACALELLSDDGSPEEVAITHADPAETPRWREVLSRIYTTSSRPGPRRLALSTGMAQLVTDIDDEYWHAVAADSEHEQQLVALGITALIAVPLPARGRNIGVMTLAVTRESGRVYSEADVVVVEDLARRAALAVDNARLFQAEREARAASDATRRRLAVQAEASRVLAASLDFDVTLRNVARVIVPAVADHVVVDLLEPDGTIRRVVSVARPEQAEVAEALLEFAPGPGDPDHFVVRVLATGRSIYVPEIRGAAGGPSVSEPAHSDLVRELAVTSTIMAPLKGHGGPVGVLTASTTATSDRRFSSEDVALVEDLAQRAAVAVEHSRLYTAERDVALTLQRSLLPEELPTVPGFTTACRYVPAAPGIAIGGDFYDIVRLPGGRLMAAMGDVEGRGVSAAARMGQLRHAMIAYALDGYTPSDILARLDRVLAGSPHRRLATLILALVSTEDGHVTLANAGHPPPLLAVPHRAVRFVEGGLGAPLGALSRARYSEIEFDLDPGAVLVFYTDGVFEDRRESADTGLDRLRDALSRAPDYLEPLVDHLIRAGQAGRAAHDDAALLALRFEVLGPRLALRLPAEANVLAPLRATLRRWLAEAGATGTEADEIVLAVGEAAANAVEHAYGPVRAHFDVIGSFDRGEVQLVVSDRGTWRSPRTDVRRGRGRLVMEAFVDTVDIATGEAGTDVVLRRRLHGFAGGVR